jgi:hypothetical protein
VTREIEYPLQIPDGGYLTFIDPLDSGLYQLQYGQAAPVLFAGAAELTRSSLPLRTLIDNDPRTPRVDRATLRPANSAAAAAGVYRGVADAAHGSAVNTAEAVWSVSAGLG